jgi:hypothetical protein
LVLDPAIAVDWKVTFDGFTSGNTVATFRIEPTSTTPVGPGTVDDVITFKWNNAQLTSLNEFAATAAAGGSAKVDAEFWMVSVSNDSRFVNSTRSRTILESRRGVVACATPNPAEVDKYIDVADNWNEEPDPEDPLQLGRQAGFGHRRQHRGCVPAARGRRLRRTGH